MDLNQDNIDTVACRRVISMDFPTYNNYEVIQPFAAGERMAIGYLYDLPFKNKMPKSYGF